MQSDPPSTGPVIFISAGEASGEHYGALLATSLQQQLAPKGETAELFGMGGPRMAAAGVERVVRSEDMAVMGITEIVLHLPRIYREFQKLKQAIRARRPSVAILIDFPDIHFRLAREFQRLGVPVIFFVSPQLWAWKQHRIKLVREFVKRMLVIFPFEEPFYRDRAASPPNLSAIHSPTCHCPPSPASSSLQKTTSTPPAPGSAFCPAAASTKSTTTCPRCSTPHAACPNQPHSNSSFPSRPPSTPRSAPPSPTLVHQHDSGLSVHLIVRCANRRPGQPNCQADARAALYHARASVVASGTATVEAALIGNPFVVVYHVSPADLCYRQAGGEGAARGHGQPHRRQARGSRTHSA